MARNLHFLIRCVYDVVWYKQYAHNSWFPWYSSNFFSSKEYNIINYLMLQSKLAACKSDCNIIHIRQRTRHTFMIVYFINNAFVNPKLCCAWNFSHHWGSYHHIIRVMLFINTMDTHNLGDFGPVTITVKYALCHALSFTKKRGVGSVV